MELAFFRRAKVRKRILTTAAALSVAAVSVAACSSGASSSSSAGGSNASASSTASASYASGKTATIVVPSDPGSLDPQLAYISDALEVDYFLYDSLINFTPSGQVESNLATRWSGDSTSASYTLKPDVTCSDGSPLTASTVAANINFISNPKNASSHLGTWAPPGAAATGDDKTGVVTVKSTVPDAFLVTDVGQALIVCGNGMKDRSTLKNGADGTGMYTLSSAEPGSSYTLTLRKGYTWGPGGATSDTQGLPATVSMKVVSNMTTAANELLSGQANISQVVGSDTQRLSGLYSQSVYAPMGELWFNEKPGGPTADVAVRRALTQAVQLGQLGQVLSSGAGKPATGAIAPALSPCKGDTIGSNLPAFDAAAAKSALAGKKLTIALYYPTSLGTGATAAATLLQQNLVPAGGQCHAEGHHRRRDQLGDRRGHRRLERRDHPRRPDLADPAGGVRVRRDAAQGRRLRLHQQRRLHGRRGQGVGDGRPGRLPELERGGDGAVQERRPGAVRQLGDHQLRQGRHVPAQPGRHPAVLHPDAGLGA